MLSIIKQFLTEQKEPECPKGQQWCIQTKKCVPIGSGTGDGPRRKRPRIEKKELIKEPPTDITDNDMDLKKIKAELFSLIDLVKNKSNLQSENNLSNIDNSIKESFKLVDKVLRESKYQEFFKSKMKKYGVTNIAQLKGDKRKQFFNDIEKEWTGEKE